MQPEEKVLIDTDRFRVVELSRTLPNKKQKTIKMVRHKPTVVVLPVDEKGNVTIEWHYREALDAWQYELPAGRPKEGEKPEECAMRELEEETGYRAGKIERMTTFIPIPGWLDLRVHAFVATGLKRTKQKLEKDELLELKSMPLDKALEMIEFGEIVDGKTILSLLYYNTYMRRREE